MHPHATPRRGRAGTARAVVGAVLLAAVLVAVLASAASAAVVWRVDPIASTTVAQGGTLSYVVQVTNDGDTTADASQVPMTFTGTLPAGLTVSSVTDVLGTGWDCSSVVPGASSFSCTSTTASLPSNANSTLAIDLAVANDASGVLVSTFSVSGGDPTTGDPSNPSATTPDPTTIAASPPPFGVDAFDGEAVDASGAPYTQAGGHPYAISTSIDFNTYTNAAPYKGAAWPVEPVKDVLVDLPPGLVGDPTNVAQCTLEQLAHSASISSLPECPASSQVGVTFVRSLVSIVFAHGIGAVIGPLPVYNMVPPPGVPARFAFDAAGSIVSLDASVRSDGDYGFSVDVKDVPEGLAFGGTSLTFWGVPSDPSHDGQRACPGAGPPAIGATGCPSSDPPTAFLRNPTSCTPDGVGLTTTLHVDSWTNPGDFREASFVSHLSPGFPLPSSEWGAPQGPTGCEAVPFTPSISTRASNPAVGQPSAFNVDLSLPQSDDPRTIGESDLRTAVVRLPAGVRINPSSAIGLAGCTPEQIGLHSLADPTCPDGSKIGTVTVTTPLLRDPLNGTVYLASPHDNPFGTLIGIYIVAKGSGVIIKQAGRVEADPVTGQLTTTVDGIPQTPFNDVRLSFNGGERSPLVNPTTCGTFTTHADLTGWSGRLATSDSSYTVSQDGNGTACSAPQFSPGFNAGTESPSAGSSSPFHVRITRTDADQELGGLTVNMPPGLTAKIANAVLCSDADAANGTCPDGTKIGDVTVGAGAGANPFFITNGRAYLTGPYKGAPFGLSIVVPAVAGPFDLGNVVVRSAIYIDKHDASVRVVSDPLPTILQGIPLEVRDVRVDVNKPGFIVNPTSCAATQVRGTITSTGGASASVWDRFQAAECRGLGFAPRMAMSVGGRGHLRTGQPTPFTTRVTMPAGDANLRYVRVSLPTTIDARLTVINDACTRAEFETDIAKCAHARAGSAVAVTPLLRDPLRGSVYFVKNGHPIPDLFVALRGQVDFDLIGRITIPGGKHLATTFDAAPDVPIKSFTLRLLGDSKNGSVGAATNLCTAKSKKATAALTYIGQNGQVLKVNQRLAIHGCPKPKARRASGRRR